MLLISFLALWLLCGFAGAYIGHRWVDKCKLDTTLNEVIFMTLLGPVTLIGAILTGVIESFDSSKVIFKRKSK